MYDRKDQNKNNSEIVFLIKILWQTIAFVEALFKLKEKKLVKNSAKDSKEKLFDDDETETINLLIGSIKLPSDKRKHVVKMLVIFETLHL